jgi:hypothetical protein
MKDPEKIREILDGALMASDFEVEDWVSFRVDRLRYAGYSTEEAIEKLYSLCAYALETSSTPLMDAYFGEWPEDPDLRVEFFFEEKDLTEEDIRREALNFYCFTGVFRKLKYEIKEIRGDGSTRPAWSPSPADYPVATLDGLFGLNTGSRARSFYRLQADPRITDEALEELRVMLVGARLFPGETMPGQFASVFGRGKEKLEKPLRWLGRNKQLVRLIDEMEDKGAAVYKWEAIHASFVDKNQQRFKKGSLKSALSRSAAEPKTRKNDPALDAIIVWIKGQMKLNKQANENA